MALEVYTVEGQQVETFSRFKNIFIRFLCEVYGTLHFYCVVAARFFPFVFPVFCSRRPAGRGNAKDTIPTAAAAL